MISRLVVEYVDLQSDLLRDSCLCQLCLDMTASNLLVGAIDL